MEKILQELGFIRQEKDCWIGFNDYLLDDLNPEYPHFLRVTVHVSRWTTGNIEQRCSKIIIHRSFDRLTVDYTLESGDSKVVYVGLLETEEDLKFILNKTGILCL